jgi:hypothetical protein
MMAATAAQIVAPADAERAAAALAAAALAAAALAPPAPPAVAGPPFSSLLARLRQRS